MTAGLRTGASRFRADPCLRTLPHPAAATQGPVPSFAACNSGVCPLFRRGEDLTSAEMDVIKVEPLTTARALRGPFDYRRPDGADVGSILEVPFGRQRLKAVVTGLAATSPHELADPLLVLPDSVPAELV